MGAAAGADQPAAAPSELAAKRTICEAHLSLLPELAELPGWVLVPAARGRMVSQLARPAHKVPQRRPS